MRSLELHMEAAVCFRAEKRFSVSWLFCIQMQNGEERIETMARAL